jgi:hypothetical protein
MTSPAEHLMTRHPLVQTSVKKIRKIRVFGILNKSHCLSSFSDTLVFDFLRDCDSRALLNNWIPNNFII